MAASLKAFLYLSSIARDVSVGCVSAILATARRNNSIYGETGVLLFDGERFCQYVEGDVDSIDALKLKLFADKRHHEIEILADQRIDRRLYGSFRMGYSNVDDVEALSNITSYMALDAIAYFQQIAESSDITA